MRAAMTLALIVTCATAWAQDFTINSAADWDTFRTNIANGETYNGKTVSLNADISVGLMVCDESHSFQGTFEGNGHTLTIGQSGNVDFIAPFSHVRGDAVFRNLTVAGYINSNTKSYAAGLIGHLFGSVTIENCTSALSITSAGGAGGFVGLCEHTVTFINCKSSAVIHSAGGSNSGFIGWSRDSGYNISFAGCVFNGKLLQINGQGNSNGGFIGWKGDSKNVTITNCLVDPAPLLNGETMANGNSATFSRERANYASITNSYYTTAFGTAQGKQRRSITTGDNVIIEAISPVGEATATYNVSGITAYTKGITRTVDETTTFYYGQDDDVRLMLGELPTGNAPAGYNYAYTASAGTLTDNGNPYTLTMPDANVIISIALRSTNIAVSVSYINENGETKTIYAVALDGTESEESELNGSAYYVGTDINYTNHITFNNYGYEGTILILGDGATMTVDNTDDAIYTHGNLTICGQALGTGKLNVNNANTDNSCIYTSDGTTINGGTVTATGGSSAIRSYYVTINGGNVTATGGSSAIRAENDVTINGGTVTATGNGDGIVAVETITLGWKNASDHIYAKSYSTRSSYVSVKDSQKLTDEDGNTYSGDNVACSAIASKTLYPEIVIFYLDENGQRQLCTNYTTLTSDMTSFGTVNQETWFVVDGSINFTSTISTAGDVHLILKDNAVMNVGTESDPFDGDGINVTEGSISIYGQSTGADKGQLNIYAQSGINTNNGSVTINGGQVTATGDGTYSVGINTNNGTVTINGGQVTVTGDDDGIFTDDGDVTINGGQVTATGNNGSGIYAFNGNVNINGGQVTATGDAYGIYANSGSVTLGWTNATDFIYANRYYAYGTLTLTKAFIDEDGNTYSGTINKVNGAYPIDGKTLYPEGVIFYLDENGQRQLCTNYTTLTSDTTSFGTAGQETWYVAEGTLNYSQTISLNGDVHLILKDNAVMNVGTEGTSINGRGYGIEVGGHTLIYAQSTGAVKGQLNVNHYTTGIRVYKDLTINGGQVTVDVSGDITLNGIWSDGSVTINGGQVTTNGNHGIRATNTTNNTVATVITINGGQVTVDASGEEAFGISADSSLIINGGHVTVDANGSKNISYGIGSDGSVTINGGSIHVSSNQYGIKFIKSLTINGGQVTANGVQSGIYSYGGNIALGWTSPTDYIYANSYFTNGTLSLTKTFKDEDGNPYNGTVTMENETYPIDGKTLRPEGVIIKQVIGYGNSTESDHWVFIASPVQDSLAPSEVYNLLGSYDEATGKYDYDLYRFNQSADKEWENYNNPAHTADFKLVNGMGYLYASKEDRTLVFSGTYNTDDLKQVTLQQGWNLVGNPFVETAYIAEGRPFYVMNADGSEIMAAYDLNQNSIAPMEGIIVQPEDDNNKVTFCTQVPGKGRGPKPEIEQVVLNLSRERGNVIDRAIVRMGESQTLPKFQIRENSTKIYIPQGAEDYAIVSVGNVGEMPVNFKAKENGTYTIAVNPEGVEMAYLHLIDNMTGADIDLLQTPTYSFNANVTDYESRFKLVFASVSEDADGDNDSFAFFSNGNWIIANEGQATLQVIDVNGRILSSESINGSVSKSIHAVPGVYMIRLINGENVKVQKIVVE
jgi:hypothetical protein